MCFVSVFSSGFCKQASNQPTKPLPFTFVDGRLFHNDLPHPVCEFLSFIRSPFRFVWGATGMPSHGVECFSATIAP